MRSTLPICNLVDRPMPLSRCIADTLTPWREAILESVSPLRTLYVTLSLLEFLYLLVLDLDSAWAKYLSDDGEKLRDFW